MSYSTSTLMAPNKPLPRGSGPESKSTKPPHVILYPLGITVFFMVFEFCGGIYTNSLSLISDAAHMFIDVAALSMSLFASLIAQRPKTARMSFGYGRAEVLAAFLSGLLIWVISGGLIYQALLRIRSPAEVKASWLCWFAFIGLVANILGIALLHAAKDRNLNLKSAYLHLFSDLIGSVGALLSGVILWQTNWAWIDPLITLLFSIGIGVSSWGLIREAVCILMESTPIRIDLATIQKALESIEGVHAVHHLHVWMISSETTALSAHLVAQKHTESLVPLAHQAIQKLYPIQFLTIQVDPLSGTAPSKDPSFS